MSYLTVGRKYESFNTSLARSENNDCVVRALAVAANVGYDIAHSFAKETFKRKNKKGVRTASIIEAFARASKTGLEIGSRKAKVRELSKDEITNKYKVKGEIIARKKTLKSFIDTFDKGTYIVLVYKHALTVIDGELADWDSLKTKPTRKVLQAFKIDPEYNHAKQLSLF